MTPREFAALASVFLLLSGSGAASPGLAEVEIPLGVELYGGNDVPPNNFGFNACGRLWLRGTNLYYRFAIDGFLLGPVELRGPAGPGTNAPVLYALAPCAGPVVGQ